MTVPYDLPDPRYAGYPEHPLARVPLGALEIVRRGLERPPTDVDLNLVDDVHAYADALVAKLVTHGYVRPVDEPRPRTLRELEKLARDPWYSRARGWLTDRWNCHVRRRHSVKMDSYGHCVRCGRDVERR